MSKGETSGNTVRMRIAVLLTIAFALLAGPVVTLSAQQPAVVRLWNWNIHDKKYAQKMYKLFNERHPEIKIEYSSIVITAYPQVLEAAFVAKEPPDLFLPNGKYEFNNLRTKGLIMPLDQVAPNEKELSDWISQFPPYLNKFVEGLGMFNGKVYTVSLGGESTAVGFPLFYNKTLFEDAGVAKPPAIQSELRQVAAKITQAGQGKFFGITRGLRSAQTAWHMTLSGGLAAVAGARGVGGPPWGPSPLDGRYHHNSPEFITGMKLLIAIRTDGSVYPGEETMDDEQAKMAFATNKAGLIFGWDWVVGNVIAYNPEVDFDLVATPNPDDGIRRAYNNVALRGAFGYVVSSVARNPKAVWEVIKFISGLEFQTGYVQGGFGISYLPEANKPENFLVKQLYKFVEWANDPALRRIAPSMSPEITDALNRVRDQYAPGIYPIWTDVLDNVYLKGTADMEAPLKDLDIRCDAAWDQGIRKANEAGIKVTREDFFWPDWDPSKDYVPKKK